MKSQSFWEAQYAAIEGIDRALTAARSGGIDRQKL
jgi:hypothetical protein